MQYFKKLETLNLKYKITACLFLLHTKSEEVKNKISQSSTNNLIILYAKSRMYAKNLQSFDDLKKKTVEYSEMLSQI